MLVDQNYASVMTKARFREDVDVVPYYVGAWAALASTWQVTSIAGALLGPVIPPSWGLEFAVPLVFLAMLAPSLNSRTAIGVAVVTGVSAAVLIPVLPMQSGLIVALLGGMAYGAWRDVVAPAEGVDPMSQTAQFWLLILLLGAGTWAMRSFPIMLHGHVPHPPWLERLLKYVPVAALDRAGRAGVALSEAERRLSRGSRAHDRRDRGPRRRPADEEHDRDARGGHGGAVGRAVGARRCLGASDDQLVGPARAWGPRPRLRACATRVLADVIAAALKIANGATSRLPSTMAAEISIAQIAPAIVAPLTANTTPSR